MPMSTTKTTQDNKQDKPVRWYQVPVLWLCIAIFILTLAACAHLIMVSLEADESHSASAQNYFQDMFHNKHHTYQGTLPFLHVYQKHVKTKHHESLC